MTKRLTNFIASLVLSTAAKAGGGFVHSFEDAVARASVHNLGGVWDF